MTTKSCMKYLIDIQDYRPVTLRRSHQRSSNVLRNAEERRER